MYSKSWRNGKGPTQGRVARTGCREIRRKGAYTDFNREDFSCKGSQRGKLKKKKKKRIKKKVKEKKKKEEKDKM
jgi:hypothetical protein